MKEISHISNVINGLFLYHRKELIGTVDCLSVQRGRLTNTVNVLSAGMKNGIGKSWGCKTCARREHKQVARLATGLHTSNQYALTCCKRSNINNWDLWHWLHSSLTHSESILFFQLPACTWRLGPIQPLQQRPSQSTRAFLHWKLTLNLTLKNWDTNYPTYQNLQITAVLVVPYLTSFESTVIKMSLLNMK